MPASRSKADITALLGNVCYVPGADIAPIAVIYRTGEPPRPKKRRAPPHDGNMQGSGCGSPKLARDPTYCSVDKWGRRMWGKVKEPGGFPEALPIRIERFFLNK